MQTIEQITSERDILRDILSVLVYWHDHDGIDESWWEEARRVLGVED